MKSPRQIHNLPPQAVYAALHSRTSGLMPHEVAERLREVGLNTVEVLDRWRWLRSLMRQLTNFFTLLLMFSAGLCFVADYLQPGEGMRVLGLALAGVALLNALFSFIQEYRAERAMEELRRYLPMQATVIRDGRESRVPIENLVPGDVIVLMEGDRLSADARLTDARELTVNNAPLTGESAPARLQAEATVGRLSDSDNIAFAGCSILHGSGTAVVFATGIRTEFGKLAHLSQAIRRGDSPLERETMRMVRILTLIAVVMGTGFFIYGVLEGRPLWVNLIFMMGIIVANVPEGLLPTFTLALAMGSLRMAKKNVLVRGLNAVEALGAVHVICTDKTGTLTVNRLTASALKRPDGSAAAPSLTALALVASDVRAGAQGFSGDPLDVAIAEAHAQHDTTAPPADRHRIFPFDTDKRRSAGIALVDDKKTVFVVKGAWESLRPLVGSIETPNGSVAAEEAALTLVEATLEGMATAGLRVIAVAWRPLAPEEEGAEQAELEHDLILAGLIGIADPLRPEIPAAVAACAAAGIETLMITGDHPVTALAVARAAGIVPPEARNLLLIGSELEALTQDALIARLSAGTRVFARTTPAQKMKIVTALRTMGKVTAMTGDGVNDAPALKAADVGIAMGKSGTDVARATAQIILLDDNFASIVSGIEEGRTVFANMRKFTTYVLASNVPEILPYLLYILLPVPLALTVLQILAIDLGTDMLPAIALGQEPSDPELMRQPPPRQGARLLTRDLLGVAYLFIGLIEAGWSLFLFFLVLTQGGWVYGQPLPTDSPLYHSATGITLASVLLMQVGNVISRRRLTGSGLDAGLLRNRLLLIGIGVEVLFAWALLFWPPLQHLLGTGPVSGSIFLLAWAGPVLLLLCDLARKHWAARKNSSAHEKRPDQMTRPEILHPL